MSWPTIVFLDRDGTINVGAGPESYVTDPKDVTLLPGSAEAVRRLNDLNVKTVLVTNQRGIARGFLSTQRYYEVASRMRDLLDERGARLDAEYMCPHDLGACVCRKPAPGMLYAAAHDLGGLDLAESVVVGDAESDVEAGLIVGAQTVRLSAAQVATRATVTKPDLATAVSWIVSRRELVGGPVASTRQASRVDHQRQF